MNTSNDLECNI